MSSKIFCLRPPTLLFEVGGSKKTKYFFTIFILFYFKYTSLSLADEKVGFIMTLMRFHFDPRAKNKLAFGSLSSG